VTTDDSLIGSISQQRLSDQVSTITAQSANSVCQTKSRLSQLNQPTASVRLSLDYHSSISQQRLSDQVSTHTREETMKAFARSLG
jgi:hypothetical protein